MERMFIETFEFQKMWADLRLDDDELCELQGYLMKNLDAGRMIQGTGGVRKLRWGSRRGEGQIRRSPGDLHRGRL